MPMVGTFDVTVLDVARTLAQHFGWSSLAVTLGRLDVKYLPGVGHLTLSRSQSHHSTFRLLLAS